MTVRKELAKYTISLNWSIREAVKKMDEGGIFFCVCIKDDGKVVGIITDGDFRRAVHDGIQLDENVKKIVNRDFYRLQKGYKRREVQSIFANPLVRHIPVLEDGKLIDLVSVDEFQNHSKGNKKKKLNCTVVIMAGGKGTRLDPFTRILPKPLMPIGNDPVIKLIMDEFNKFGMEHFYISLQDKERMVRAYFHDHDFGYRIEYLHETQPLGTAGALKFLEGRIKRPFFVSNCDIIVRTDYGSFFDFHKHNNNALTIVGSMRQYIIPYGVCKAHNGVLKNIQEKPRYDFLVNTGMYLLQPEVLKLIPQGQHFNMTDLIRQVQLKGWKVGIFPVSENSWIDVGQLSEYKKMIDQLNGSV